MLGMQETCGTGWEVSAPSGCQQLYWWRISRNTCTEVGWIGESDVMVFHTKAESPRDSSIIVIRESRPMVKSTIQLSLYEGSARADGAV